MGLIWPKTPKSATSLIYTHPINMKSAPKHSWLPKVVNTDPSVPHGLLQFSQYAPKPTSTPISSSQPQPARPMALPVARTLLGASLLPSSKPRS